MVGLGDTKKKIQKMIDAAEDLYAKMNELRAQMDDLRETVETTGRQVDSVERDVEQQRVLIEAIAAEHDIDVDEVLAEAAIDDVDAEDGADGETAAADAEN